jgi:hypothetical protein
MGARRGAGDRAFEAVFAFSCTRKAMNSPCRIGASPESRCATANETARRFALEARVRGGVARTARPPRRAIALAGGVGRDAVELRRGERAALFPVMRAPQCGVLLGIEEETVLRLAGRAMRASAKRALESGRNPGEAADAFA